VRASATSGVVEREIGSGPSAGTRFPAATPTHISALLALRSGIPAVLLASFDTVAHTLPRFEVYGTRGTLSLPDPDKFDGPLRLHDGDVWHDVPMRNTAERDRRGIGLAHLARQLAAGSLDEASAQRALHTVDVMTGILRAAESGGTVAMRTGSAS
jgi:predicted dehydrogenase